MLQIRVKKGSLPYSKKKGHSNDKGATCSPWLNGGRYGGTCTCNLFEYNLNVLISSLNFGGVEKLQIEIWTESVNVVRYWI